LSARFHRFGTILILKFKRINVLTPNTLEVPPSVKGVLLWTTASQFGFVGFLGFVGFQL